jgi:hypothetical protein
MASLTGLQSGFFTDIDVVDTIAIDGYIGTLNQVLTSDGTKTSYQDPSLPPVSDLIVAGTGITITATGNPESVATNVKSLVLSGNAVTGTPQTFNPNADGGSQTITITDTNTEYTATQPISLSVGNDIGLQYDNDTIILDGGDIAVAKVPTTLTFTGYDTGTFDGSSALSINLVDTNTEYTATQPIAISVSDVIELQYDNDTIILDGGDIAVAKVPNQLVKGSNISFSTGTTYDGSASITISSTDTNTTYSAGDNISIAGIGNSISLNQTILDQNSIQFNIDGSSTTLTGSNYPQKPTVGTYLNLTSPTNIISPYFLHDVYDPVSTVTQSLTTGFVPIFSSNLSNTFTAQASNCCMELIVYNFTSSGNRYLYFQLEDGAGTEWSIGTSGGGSGTGTRSTIRTNHAADETDKQEVRQTWYLQGLTIGTSYTVNPAAKTSTQYNYLFGGGSYQATILRGYYLPPTGAGS